MTAFDKEVVKQILMEKFGFNTFEAELTAGSFNNIHVDLHDALSGYLEQRIEQHFEFQGISIAQIMDLSRCNYLNALFKMDNFISNPTLIEEYKSIRPERRHKVCGGIKRNG